MRLHMSVQYDKRAAGNSPFLLQSAQALLSGCLTSSRKILAFRSVVALSSADERGQAMQDLD